MVNIRKLESELWESADLLRAGSKLTSNQYCMPVLGLIFLRYAYSRFKLVEAEILKNRPSRGGRVLPVEASAAPCPQSQVDPAGLQGKIHTPPGAADPIGDPGPDFHAGLRLDRNQAV